MDFREAAQLLGRQITTADMAKELDVSGHAVRQARLQEGAPGYRKAPEGWRTGFSRLALTRIEELQALISELSSEAK